MQSLRTQVFDHLGLNGQPLGRQLEISQLLVDLAAFSAGASKQRKRIYLLLQRGPKFAVFSRQRLRRRRHFTLQVLKLLLVLARLTVALLLRRDAEVLKGFACVSMLLFQGCRMGMGGLQLLLGSPRFQCNK